jgi:Matrixin
LLVGCGEGGSSSTPSTPTTPTPPAPQPTSWSVSGRLVETIGGQPVDSAHITPAWDLAALTTGADGAFSLSSTVNPPTNPYRLSIAGPDIVSRDLWVGWQSSARTGVTLDVIRNRAPFSMEFYRQFVRGTYDQSGAPYAVFRLTNSPSFYVRTVDQNGRAIEPEVLAVVLEAIPRAVTEFSAGRLSVANLETGTESRATATGWIIVNIRRDPNERQTCGFANIGAMAGSITLNNDVCSCGSNKIPGALVLHEVGHALGFFHVPDRNSVMYPFLPGNCPSGTLSANEKFHAAIAYSRPRGNLDPDNDPSASQFITAPAMWTDR